jgi:hypothetical protein
MARHVCGSCGTTVVDEEFCPNCGAWIDTIADRRRSDDEYEQFELSDQPPAQATAPPPGAIACPSCGALNPRTNRHCEECGARLMQGPLPTAPRPAVQATAGVRAVIAISGLLLGVILLALLFRVFSGGAEVTTAVSTTVAATNGTSPPPTVEVVRILKANCTPEGLGGAFICTNLVNDSPGKEFQINWNELPEDEKKVVIELIFEEPTTVRRIDWTNLTDPTRFLQNYRAKSLSVVADDSALPTALSLADEEGTQSLDFAAISTNRLTITVLGVYEAQVVEDQIFDELAIDEIVVLGYRYQAVTETTTSTTAAP